MQFGKNMTMVQSVKTFGLGSLARCAKLRIISHSSTSPVSLLIVISHHYPPHLTACRFPTRTTRRRSCRWRWRRRACAPSYSASSPASYSPGAAHAQAAAAAPGASATCSPAPAETRIRTTCLTSTSESCARANRIPIA